MNCNRLLAPQFTIDQTFYRMLQKPMAVQDPQVIKPLSKRAHDITFALALTHEDFSCGLKIVKTEHAKIIIFKTILGQLFENNKIRKIK